MTNFGVRNGGSGIRAISSREGSIGKHYCSFAELSLYLASPVQVGATSVIPINLANITCLTMVIP